jgi:hypothetical protein
VIGGPTESKRVKWYARADSNGRPFAPEAHGRLANQLLTLNTVRIHPSIFAIILYSLSPIGRVIGRVITACQFGRWCESLSAMPSAHNLIPEEARGESRSAV